MNFEHGRSEARFTRCGKAFGNFSDPDLTVLHDTFLCTFFVHKEGGGLDLSVMCSVKPEV